MGIKSDIKYYTKLLSDFTIIVTDDIWNHLKELYPNDIAMENYTRKLIKERLDD